MDIKRIFQPGKCPHCGGKVGYARTDAYLYGSPIRTCPGCKQQYLNPNFHEIEVDGCWTGDTSLEESRKGVRNGLILILAAVALNVLFYVLGRASWIYLLFVGMGVVYFIMMLKDYCKVKKGTRQQELEEERLASRKRLQDPAYAKLLQELGYEVPEEYLGETAQENT